MNYIANAFAEDNLSRSIKKHTQTPKERFDRPQTSAMEIGWYSQPLVIYINIDATSEMG
jgi:hypothetical protein